eukprot:Protomagalhaensia_wolfi_Nauph_80__5802@NODE_721_length_2068_cov_35_617053_g537_i0_p1_GENE_NODE_721_length_2068_cov_35_617053_g537_i0NODE_721_length_2068_cov_35_617053_g537_i0_p1_ORF_typecomplete_len184_score43_21Gpatch_2/PF12656_7/5_5e03Gpatch_2/PF12656_7/1_7e06_NODE_721_length_2068_cov_35_617053_g537_i0255806
MMKLSFGKKGQQPQTAPAPRDLSTLFGNVPRPDESPQVERITVLGKSDGKRQDHSPLLPKPNPYRQAPKEPIKIYDPATEGKAAWLERFLEDDDDAELGPPTKDSKKEQGESLLARAAKNRVIGDDPHYNLVAMEDYGMAMLRQLGLEEKDTIPDTKIKVRPYSQAGLGANIQLPTEKKNSEK